MLDDSNSTINDGYFAIDLSKTGSPEGLGAPNPYYIIDLPSSQHIKSGTGTVSFADGHPSIHKWQEDLKSNTKAAQFHAGAQNRDALWLQQHSATLK